MVRTRGEDADEQRVIDDMERYGWLVVRIEADEEGPGFAYSVGMFHTIAWEGRHSEDERLLSLADYSLASGVRGRD